MKKILTTLFLATLLVLTAMTIILSSKGIETSKFNNLISKKISQTNNNINLKISSIKFKLDIKEISLFLETIEPQIDYRGIIIPAKNIKVYMDFMSLIKSDPKIKKINLSFNQLDIKQLKKLSIAFKPSNFKNFINNKIKQGKLNTEIEIYLDNNNLLENFIARGTISNLKAEVIDNINLNKTKLSFFADKTDVLIKNIYGETGPIKIKDGDIKLRLSPEIYLESNFTTTLKYSGKSINYKNLIQNFEYFKNLSSLEGDLNNSFTINFDETYKVKKYDYKIDGKILKANFNFDKFLKDYDFEEKINQLSLINSEIKTNFNSKKKQAVISGKYSLNKGNSLSYDLNNIIEGDLLRLKLDIEYDKPIDFELINFKKSKDSIANISLNFDKKKDNIKIKKLDLINGKNSILVENMIFNKNNFSSLKKISVQTNIDGKKNNDFSITYGKKIVINGTQFDATNLPKFLQREATSKSRFSQISKDIDIDFKNIIAPLSENLKNFKLFGKIEKGKFTKISSKGDFGEGNFLDITMKKDQKNQKKYLEIYSDITRPLLTEYSFFKGLTGGNLLYSSIIDGDNSNSKLKIENFNVINAPGMVKLLSLADLGGLADLAEGDGLSFDFLEIKMEKNKNLLKLNEILAIGPSISVLMDGYLDQDGLTSLRGTLVPAKTLNKLISKIPVLGNIIIPKEVGEGLFGISFKMKGSRGKIKTTINPIRTITPRFIQKIIDKNKKSK
ncbi:hypothetical protein OAR56_01905 [Pelagibacteraceae bacterium]|nr:hypothetical protein [Pelagibacteraceae bacterium]